MFDSGGTQHVHEQVAAETDLSAKLPAKPGRDVQVVVGQAHEPPFHVHSHSFERALQVGTLDINQVR